MYNNYLEKDKYELNDLKEKHRRLKIKNKYDKDINYDNVVDEINLNFSIDLLESKNINLKSLYFVINLDNENKNVNCIAYSARLSLLRDYVNRLGYSIYDFPTRKMTTLYRIYYGLEFYKFNSELFRNNIKCNLYVVRFKLIRNNIEKFKELIHSYEYFNNVLEDLFINL